MVTDYPAFGEVGLGAHVYTSNGDDLGAVKAVAGHCFKVDTTMSPDCWLPTECIRTASAQRVELMIDKDHLGDFKVDDPTKA